MTVQSSKRGRLGTHISMVGAPGLEPLRPLSTSQDCPHWPP